ncbi:hypothetical protein OC713_02570 [Sweet potato little leaf phytoplasma]|uniref:hypothetical protein n=1 Tax=Candidatus Phytoplasma australasiaticum TaxID=2754999 RepID=UPI002713678C|nr:hypothetical protein [Sweet potato little leaf phytoplasma]MDO7987389.1 hypothetical protein [Sweet potato little leaf phytoplasma]
MPTWINFSGWKSFSELLRDFLNGKNETVDFVSRDYPKTRKEEGKSFADIVKTKPTNRPPYQNDSCRSHKEERSIERSEKFVFNNRKDEVRKIN